MGLIKSSMLKDEIRILDKNALMDLGYVRFSIYMDAIKADISASKADELKDLVEVSTTYSVLPAKIKFLLASGYLCQKRCYKSSRFSLGQQN